MWQRCIIYGRLAIGPLEDDRDEPSLLSPPTLGPLGPLGPGYGGYASPAATAPNRLQARPGQGAKSKPCVLRASGSQ